MKRLFRGWMMKGAPLTLPSTRAPLNSKELDGAIAEKDLFS
jgi:hypothetical protein